MNKEPQNIIKISSQHSDGDYSQTVFDAYDLDSQDLMAKFTDFLRGIGYYIDYETLGSALHPCETDVKRIQSEIQKEPAR
jgi:hypothetical protein